MCVFVGGRGSCERTMSAAHQAVCGGGNIER